MAKVSNVKTAAPGSASQGAAPVADAPAQLENVVYDTLGRCIVIGQRDIVTESRIIRALGDAAMNTAYVAGYVTPAAMVLSIDGEECKAPKTALEIEARIQLVGREGITAVLLKLTADAEKRNVEMGATDESTEEVKK